MYYYDAKSDFIVHSGVQGMKWGVRRYQNEDGTLTEEGKRRYRKSNFKEYKTEVRKDRFGDTRALKEFYSNDGNKDLKKRANSQIEKQRLAEIEWTEADDKRSVAKVVNGPDSKAFKNADAKRNKAEKNLHRVYENSANLRDEITKKAYDFANDFFGDYGSKKIAGFNVPGGKKTAAELLAREIIEYESGNSSVEDSLYKR